MTFRGHIKNGQIVPDSEVTLPEGTRIEFRRAERPKKAGAQRPKAKKAAKSRTTRPAKSRRTAKPKTLYDRLKPFIGIIKDLPPDASRNIDHYLYGHPKRP